MLLKSNYFNLLHLKPNLLGIGCAKCGKTSIAKLLNSHPEVSVARGKELHFFDEKQVNQLNFISYLTNFKPNRFRFEFTP